MRTTFPVEQARCFLIDCVRDSLTNELRDHAEVIVDLHLDPTNYAMPRNIDGDSVQTALARGDCAKKLRRYMIFENTTSIQGICRVMVRTHLNRSGVGFVSRGEPDKTQARRVLGIFNDHFDPKILLEWKVLITTWLDFTENVRSDSNTSDKNSLFNNEDIKSLKNLALLDEGQLYYAKRNPEIHNNWAKVAVGIHSGLTYLSRRYRLDAMQVWHRIDEASKSISDVKALMDEASREIVEYGKALAGSFFADLGGKNFVKVDTHVRDSIAAILNKEASQVSSDLAFDIIQRTAAKYQIPPRAVDKIMFLAGSSNLYLIGHRLTKSRQQKQKKRFLNYLRSIA